MKKIITTTLIFAFAFSLISCNDASKDKQVNDSLTIYFDVFQKAYLANAIEIYKQANPDITVTTIQVDGHTKTRKEIMMGKGPDIILVDGKVFPDTKKAINTGIFADMTPFLENDKSYNPDDFYGGIINAGKQQDKQYVFPVCFTIPAFITTSEALSKYNLTFTDKPDLLEVTEQAVKFIEQNNINTIQLFPKQLDDSRFNYFNIISDIIDYDAVKIDFNNDKFLQATQNFKEFYKTGNTLVDHGLIGYYQSEDTAKYINNRFLLYNTNYWNNNSLTDFMTLSKLKAKNNPLFVPIYGFDNKINAKMKYGLAINNFSPNKQNAYDFIKTILDLPFNATDYMNRIVGYSTKKSEWQGILNESNRQIINDEIALPFKATYYAKKLGEDFVLQHEEMLSSIEKCSLPSGINNMLYDVFLPYFGDEATLESCLEAAQSAMEIYKSE